MTPKLVFVVIAVLCALAALLGLPHDVESGKVLAVGLISAAVAIVVP